jgi:ferredoxin-NADP reductase
VAKRAFEDAAQSQCSFYLEPLDGLALPPYKPGQFLTFSLMVPGQPGEAARSITRCYSLSDSPVPNHYRVTIKRVPAPAQPAGLPAGLSSNYFHDHVHAGDTLQLRAPAGHFHLDTAALTPVVLLAGGIGITPMFSMLRWCAQHQPQRAVHLYFGVRNSAEHAYKALLEDMAAALPTFTLQVVYSNPLPEDTHTVDYQHKGYVNLDLLKTTLPHGPHQFYICGPTAMLESLVPALVEWGVATADIHFEAFGPASVRLPASAAEAPPAAVGPLQIQFTRSGRTLEWTGKESNLLDFAEKHGIAVESGCRSGSCGSCVTTVARGEVDYANPPDYELAPGQCLLCVGKPRAPLTLDA